MSAEAFTPTTEQVRDGYRFDPEAEYRDPVNAGHLAIVAGYAFDRWLAAHDAEVAAKAIADLVEGFDKPLIVEHAQMREIGAPGWLKAREVKP